MRAKALIAWSSGKDSAWALHEALRSGDYEIGGALTTVTENFARVAMHGVREALLRERYRGGQSFYVCPRIEDLDEAAAFLRQNMPEAKFVVAHGQMPAAQLAEVMRRFVAGEFDALVCTVIVESGMDIPNANTILIDRADRFGLHIAGDDDCRVLRPVPAAEEEL